MFNMSNIISNFLLSQFLSIILKFNPSQEPVVREYSTKKKTTYMRIICTTKIFNFTLHTGNNFNLFILDVSFLFYNNYWYNSIPYHRKYICVIEDNDHLLTAIFQVPLVKTLSVDK